MSAARDKIVLDLIASINVVINNAIKDDPALLFKYQGFDFDAIALELLKQKPEDLADAIVLYATRGTNIDRIRTKVGSDAARDRIDALKRVMNIVHKPAASLGPKDITLGRIGAIYAPIVCAIYKRKPGGFVPVATGYSGTLTGYLQCPGGASMCKTDVELREWVEWSVLFTKVTLPASRTFAESSARSKALSVGTASRQNFKDSQILAFRTQLDAL